MCNNIIIIAIFVAGSRRRVDIELESCVGGGGLTGAKTIQKTFRSWRLNFTVRIDSPVRGSRACPNDYSRPNRFYYIYICLYNTFSNVRFQRILCLA